MLVIVAASYGAFDALLHPAKASENMPFAISLICAAIPCWFVGRFLLRHTVKVTDKTTGDTLVVPQPYHALFWIPMHWWAPILIAFGVWGLIIDAKQPSPGTPAPVSPSAVAATVPAGG